MEWIVLFIIAGVMVLVFCCLRAAGWAEDEAVKGAEEVDEEKHNSK